MTCDTSIAHYSTWQLIVEKWKSGTYDTDTVYYSMKYLVMSNTHVHWYITMLSHNIHISYFQNKFNIKNSVCVVHIKTCVTWNNMQYHTHNFQTEI